jgi:hypothetical protein
MNSDMYKLLSLVSAINRNAHRNVVPAGQNHEQVKVHIERQNQIADTRRFLNVGKRKKLKR